MRNFLLPKLQSKIFLFFFVLSILTLIIFFSRSKRGSSSKQKKSRKIPNPLSPVVSSSPMKMIYRHLGFTDFFWANNSSYSLSKASRHDLPKNHERKEEEPPEELSDNESMSSTSSSKSRSSLWRKLTGLEPEHGENLFLHHRRHCSLSCFPLSFRMTF